MVPFLIFETVPKTKRKPSPQSAGNLPRPAGSGKTSLWFFFTKKKPGKAPEAARRTTCTNNLKQIGLALHGFHDAHKALPKLKNGPDTNGSNNPGVLLRLGPFPHLSAFLEEQAIYDRAMAWTGIAYSNPVGEQEIATLVCPSDTQKIGDGVLDVGYGRQNYGFSVGDCKMNMDHTNSYKSSRGVFANGTMTQFHKISDGLSKTIALVAFIRPAGRGEIGDVTNLAGPFTLGDGSTHLIAETIAAGSPAGAAHEPTDLGPSRFGVWGSLGTKTGGESSESL